MDVPAMLDKINVLENGYWMVGYIKEKGVKITDPNAIRYFSYREGVFYVCRSTGADTVAIEYQFRQDQIDVFKTLPSFLILDPTITIIAGDKKFSFGVLQNAKVLKDIAHLMNNKA